MQYYKYMVKIIIIYKLVYLLNLIFTRSIKFSKYYKFFNLKLNPFKFNLIKNKNKIHCIAYYKIHIFLKSIKIILI